MMQRKPSNTPPQERLFRAQSIKERMESIHQQAKEIGIDLPLPARPWWDEEIKEAIGDIQAGRLLRT